MRKEKNAGQGEIKKETEFFSASCNGMTVSKNCHLPFQVYQFTEQFIDSSNNF